MRSEYSKILSVVIIAVAFVAFVYGTYKAIGIVQKRQIGTSDGIYSNHVTTNRQIEVQAHRLIEGCESRLCEVQRLLDYVTHIPYRINRFQAHSPQRTIQNNFGDCDDKSNLLISMLHALGIEAYFVLVPKHIFVIVQLDDARLDGIPGLWIDGRKFYILESTAEGSRVGFPFHYRVDQIEAIVEPFSNQKQKYRKITYKL